MSMTVTADGQTYEVWTQVTGTDRYTDTNVKGVECAYVRPCGIAPDGFHIPRDLVQPLLDEGLIWVNEPPDNDEPEKLWDLGVMGESESRVELRNLRTIEDRIQEAFLRRVDEERAAEGKCKRCAYKVEQAEAVWYGGLLYHAKHSPGSKLKPGADPTCAMCVQIGTGFGPNHKASSRCESGGHAHCTCDTCF